MPASFLKSTVNVIENSAGFLRNYLIYFPGRSLVSVAKDHHIELLCYRVAIELLCQREHCVKQNLIRRAGKAQENSFAAGERSKDVETDKQGYA